MPQPPQRTPTALDAVADAHVDAAAALDPVGATFAGVAGHDHEVPDLSPAGHAARAEQARTTLARARAAGLADDTDRDTLAALHDRLGAELDLHDAGLDLASLNNLDSPVQHLRDVFDVAPTATADDWAAVAARLAALPGALAGYRASLREAAARGVRPAARQVRLAAQQAETCAAADGFFATFVAQAPAEVRADAAAVADLARGAGAAAGAYGELARWLRHDLAPLARDDDAVGRDTYALCSRTFLGTTVDLDDTYAWGLDELARIEGRMAGLAAGIAPDAAGDVPARVREACARLDADPARRVHGAEAFSAWMQDHADRALAALDGTHFDVPGPVRTLRCAIAPSTSGGVYYTPPSEDFSRPGTMWWSVPTGVTSFSTWQETTTVYHEGVPGHHLQCGVALAEGATLNRWRRLFAWTSGHGEGWALYAERLMEELGHLDDPGDLMGMLDAQALRAARVVVDIGVHCRLQAPAEVGGGVWDAGKAWTYLRTHTRVPDPSLRFELDRYLGWPGQAPSYKIGERVWLELRAECAAHERARGLTPDLRAFHARALRIGSVGLDVLRGSVLRETPSTPARTAPAADAAAPAPAPPTAP